MRNIGLLEEGLTRSVIGAFYEVYNSLGYGFLEHLYQTAMERELQARGHLIGREFGVRVMYKGEQIGMQRLDMIVDERLVVEIKSTRILPVSALRQLYSYLHATNLRVGLVLHFGPTPAFRRLIHDPSRRSPSDPPHPIDPFET
jgi:GxxExxY protein